MTVAKLAQTDMTVDNPTTYKANIDANFNVLSKVGNDFAPYANSPSAMNLKVAEGKLKTGSCGTNQFNYNSTCVESKN